MNIQFQLTRFWNLNKLKQRWVITIILFELRADLSKNSVSAGVRKNSVRVGARKTFRVCALSLFFSIHNRQKLQSINSF